MKTLIIATRNKKKLTELRKLLKGLPVKIAGLDVIKKRIPDIKEDKSTFAGNAKKKALTISKLVKDALVLADDSGLCVKSLKGAPGVNSARYAGHSQNDNRNIAKLLKNMQGKKERSAYFISTAVIARNNKVIGIVEGRVYGRIIEEKRGNNGFGYDPVFMPKGHKSTFAQMKPSFKNRISHRYKAIKQAKFIIEDYTGADT